MAHQQPSTDCDEVRLTIASARSRPFAGHDLDPPLGQKINDFHGLLPRKASISTLKSCGKSSRTKTDLSNIGPRSSARRGRVRLLGAKRR
jgi:hypothetical protein